MASVVTMPASLTVLMKASVTLVVMMLALFPLLEGYNVDVQNVAVYRGPEDAMFGFSVSGYTDRDSSW